MKRAHITVRGFSAAFRLGPQIREEIIGELLNTNDDYDKKCQGGHLQ